MEFTDILELTNIMSKYPFLEKMVALAITLLFARHEIKKRFKDLTDGMNKLASAFTSHQEAFNNHQKESNERITKIETHIGLKK